MKRTLILLLAISLCLSLCLSVCSCSTKWTREDIAKAHTVEITQYNSDHPNIRITYTITDEETVKSLCSTFSLLELEDMNMKGTTTKSFYIRFIGNGGEIDHITVISGRNIIQDKHGYLYNITDEDEMDINRHLNEVIASAPAEIKRDPEENYAVFLLEPSHNRTFAQEDAPPVFSWSIQEGFPQAFVIEIDYRQGGTYMTIPCHSVSYMLSQEDWETIKAHAPINDGKQKIQWRIRIDPVYHADLEPYYTGWSYFWIEQTTE